MSTESSVLLRNGFEAQGIVDFNGAKIVAQLNCLGAKFWAEPVTLQCYASTVGVDAVLSGGFEAARQGQIRPSRDCWEFGYVRRQTRQRVNCLWDAGAGRVFLAGCTGGRDHS